MSKRSIVAVCVLPFLLALPLAAAQEPGREAEPDPLRTFRARVTAHRYQGETRVESTPYDFVVRERSKATIHVTTEVPVPVTTFMSVGEPEQQAGIFSPATSFQYKSVGLSIECGLGRLDRDDRGAVHVTIDLEHSFLAGASNLDGQRVPRFISNRATLQLDATLGRVHHLAAMRQPDSDDSLVWEFVLEPPE